MINELLPIARYMAEEISDNASSYYTISMARLNSHSLRDCIVDGKTDLSILLPLGIYKKLSDCVADQLTNSGLAMLVWSLLVRPDGDWDHKPYIAANFKKDTINGSGCWHRYDYWDYYYDVWSNIHYGYIGLAAGFSERVLLNGAGLAQIASNGLQHFKSRPQAGQSEDLLDVLAAFDDPADQIGIKIGMSLFRSSPNRVSAQTLVERITTTPGITKKAIHRDYLKHPAGYMYV